MKCIYLLSVILGLLFFGRIACAQQPQPTKPPTTGSQPAYEGEIKDPSRDELDGEFKKRTEQQVLRLQEYIQIISDKTQSDENRDKAIKEAIKLFQPGSLVQVSSGKKGTPVISRTVGDYFRRLKALQYQQVEINFYDATYVGDYRKGADGGYYTTATFSQEFKGKDEKGNIIYQDKTTKDIDVSLQNLMDEDFYKQNRWIIKFGNIKVTETKKAAKPIN
ncbi:hypothetical protein [Runella sp.]|uniref:hypothetical protein n=1 Tax=Runella sp. TaxID=1960881 RepID=UPI003D11F0CF